MKTVDEYIGGQPEEVRGKLAAVRAVIRRAAPEAEEMISYKIAGYKLRGKKLIYFAGWKEHCALYPVGKREQEAFAEQLKELDVAGSTVRIPWKKTLPVKLIERLVRFRAEEILGSSPRRATERHGEERAKPLTTEAPRKGGKGGSRKGRFERGVRGRAEEFTS